MYSKTEWLSHLAAGIQSLSNAYGEIVAVILFGVKQNFFPVVSLSSCPVSRIPEKAGKEQKDRYGHDSWLDHYWGERYLSAI